MNEEQAFERYWAERQRETWERSLTAEERAAGRQHSPAWGRAFYADAKAAWMARAGIDSEVIAEYTQGDGERQWVAVGTWLRPGERVVWQGEPEQPTPPLRSDSDD